MPDMFSTLALPFAACVLAAVACGAAGTLCAVRHDTYVAGAVSHACFAGIGFARWLSAVCGCHWATPALGASCAAVAAALFIALSPAARGARSDGALSAVWAVGMAVGLAFMAATPGYQTDLSAWLFGSVLFVSGGDVAAMAAFDAALVALLFAFRRGVLSICFDERLSVLRGEPAKIWKCALSVAVAVAVVLLVRVVGIVLAVAMLSLPAMAARPFARRLVPAMFATGAAALASLSAGLAASWWLDAPPSAPTVLAAAALALLSSRLRRPGAGRRARATGRAARRAA